MMNMSKNTKSLPLYFIKGDLKSKEWAVVRIAGTNNSDFIMNITGKLGYRQVKRKEYLSFRAARRVATI